MASHPIDWNALREAVPVELLAQARYGAPDRNKSTAKTAQWNTPDQGRLLVNRADQYWKFMDSGLKGQGPIDWLIRVEGLTAFQAAERLSNQTFAEAETLPKHRVVKPKPYVRIPDNPALWPLVRTYLVEVRKLPANLIDQWHNTDRLRGISPSPRTQVPYAAFPLVSPEGKEVGAALRCAGTSEQVAEQEARGYMRKRNQDKTQATEGFWQSHDAPQARSLVLVEAPLDGMALYAALVADHRDPQDFVIRACGGEALNAVHWSGDWQHLVAGFDRDPVGERFSQKVLQAHPDRDVRRLTPPPGTKDWSEAWAAHCASVQTAQVRAKARETAYEIGDD